MWIERRGVCVGVSSVTAFVKFPRHCCRRASMTAENWLVSVTFPGSCRTFSCILYWLSSSVFCFYTLSLYLPRPLFVAFPEGLWYFPDGGASTLSAMLTTIKRSSFIDPHPFQSRFLLALAEYFPPLIRALKIIYIYIHAFSVFHLENALSTDSPGLGFAVKVTCHGCHLPTVGAKPYVCKTLPSSGQMLLTSAYLLISPPKLGSNRR